MCCLYQKIAVFFKNFFLGKEYTNCIVFSEAGFTKYGDDGGWEYTREDEIWAFRLTDGRYGKVGDSPDFPEIDWSPPSWVFDVEPCSKSHTRSQSEGESDEDEDLDSNRRAEKDGEVPSDIVDLSNEDEQDGEMQTDLIGRDQEQEEMGSDPESEDQADKVIQCYSDSQENDDEQMHSDDNIKGRASSEEDLSPSLSGPESQSTDFPFCR
ncbi:hypothetical protein RND81_14G172400 [Saponaria officinalis]|uniref:Uncharacterized protein n=1 Tax=Saponaria officinalis TaxID=3572 RepID=A0AAW1GTB0_SAPOF